MEVAIARESPDTPDARRLIDELENYIGPMYPRESQHGYTVEMLIEEGVDFHVVRVGGEAIGCGGVQVHGSEYAELKRMWIRPEHRGRGLAKLLVERLAEAAAGAGAPVLRLETGIHQYEAIALYERMGFVEIPAFPPYQPDPLSVFYERPSEPVAPDDR